MTNLAANLVDTANGHADRVAVRVGETAMTYGELDQASSRVAGMLRERGVKPGDPVGIMVPNVAEFAVIYYGVLRAGGAVVPMNPLLKAREVSYYLGDSGARLIFAWHAFAGEAQAGAQQAAAEAVVVEPATFPGLLAAAAPDGWFRTGDMGRVDADGYYEIIDRKKDMIIRGGYNVYPREIEEVLYEHPAVAEAAVIGLPHPALGEEVGAAVVLKPGAGVTADELRDHVKSQVAAYKYPRAVWIVDELPKGATGKIVKREIVPPADLNLR